MVGERITPQQYHSYDTALLQILDDEEGKMDETDKPSITVTETAEHNGRDYKLPAFDSISEYL